MSSSSISPKKISIQCPLCSQRFIGHWAQAGRKGHCPNKKCNALLRLPSKADWELESSVYVATIAKKKKKKSNESAKAASLGSIPSAPTQTIPQKPKTPEIKQHPPGTIPPSPSDLVNTDPKEPSSISLSSFQFNESVEEFQEVGPSKTKWILAGFAIGASILIIASLFQGSEQNENTPTTNVGNLLEQNPSGALLALGQTLSEAEIQEEQFQKTFKPFVKEFCIDCHSGDEPEADFNITLPTKMASIKENREHWEKVLKMLEFNTMPPEDSDQPMTDKKNDFISFLEYQLFHVDCELVDNPGRVTIRRLNRNEYDNTVRDLLGVDSNPSKDFPSDDVGYGFDNIGDVLSLPPILLEKYVDAAEEIAAQAVLTLDAGNLPKIRKTKRQFRVTQGEPGLLGEVWGMSSSATLGTEIDVKEAGSYRFRLRAFATQAGDELAKMQVKFEGTNQVISVDAKRNDPQWYEFDRKLNKGTKKVSVAFINDFYDPKNKNPARRDRNLYFLGLEVIGPLELKEKDLPKSHQELIVYHPKKDKMPVMACYRENLRPLLTKAFRRPIHEDELEGFAKLGNYVFLQGDSFEKGMQVAVTGILVSPHFLFRVEKNEQEAKESGRDLNQYELASRLSYFLWSSMPDETLFKLAEEGKLSDQKVLVEQADRMLKDPRSQALIDNFFGQWLNLQNLDGITVDQEKFKSFSKKLRADMRSETEMFCKEIVEKDRSILDFIDGDFSYVNERLANHYGMKNVKGESFQRVKLNPSQRAGVLTQGSVLTLTSYPTRTSPVLRGKWVMENILGVEPPEPPPNVPALETVKAPKDSTLRQQLEIHRANPACNACHKSLDSVGFGFENFNAVGQWRELDNGQPIDASAELPGGEKFAGPVELVKILRQREKEFAQTFCKKLMTFGLGRGLDYYDQCAVDQIVLQISKKDYRFSELVKEIVISDPFLKRVNE